MKRLRIKRHLSPHEDGGRSARAGSQPLPNQDHASVKLNQYTVYYLIVLTSLLKQREGPRMCIFCDCYAVPMLRPGAARPDATTTATHDVQSKS